MRSCIFSIVILFVLTCSINCQDGVSSCLGRTQRFEEDEDETMNNDIKRRILQQQQQHHPRYYISYDTLKKEAVPCERPGSSYYNCRSAGVANPYTRGCLVITGCARDLRDIIS